MEKAMKGRLTMEALVVGAYGDSESNANPTVALSSGVALLEVSHFTNQILKEVKDKLRAMLNRAYINGFYQLSEKITHNNCIKNARKRRGLGPRKQRAALYARRYVLRNRE
jgi:hypothetical protein